MKLKITQNGYGRYNVFGNTQTTSFSLNILNDDEKILKEEWLVTKDGKETKYEKFCKLYYGGEEDRTGELQELYNKGDIKAIFDLCYKENNGLTSYGRAVNKHNDNYNFFMEMFNSNKQELETNWRRERMDEIMKEKTEVSLVYMPKLEIPK